LAGRPRGNWTIKWRNVPGSSNRREILLAQRVQEAENNAENTINTGSVQQELWELKQLLLTSHQESIAYRKELQHVNKECTGSNRSINRGQEYSTSI
jgi:hypothetical protein